MAVKKYRVNGSELFNIESMYDHLMVQRDQMYEGITTWSDEVLTRLEEITEIMDKLHGVGSLVDWPTLKRIREIKEERQLIRYSIALSSGATEREAANAFTL